MHVMDRCPALSSLYIRQRDGGDVIGRLASELSMDVDSVGLQVAARLQLPWLSAAAVDALRAADTVDVSEALLQKVFLAIDAEGRTLAVLANPWNDAALG